MSFKLKPYSYLLTAMLYGSVLCYQSHAANWPRNSETGWSFYKESLKKPKTEKEKDKNQRRTIHTDEASDSSIHDKDNDRYIYAKQMEKFQKELQDLQAKATLYPTIENVMAFRHMHDQIVNRSEDFSKAWMLSGILSGDHYKEGDNASPKYRKIYEETQEAQLDQKIHQLSKTHGLFFTFKQECPYCHQMAPVVKQLQDEYHFAVKAISPDGSSLELFPDAVKDNGALAIVNRENVFPMVYLVHPGNGEIIPIARGLINIVELKQNLKIVIEEHLERKSHVQ